MAEPAGSDSGGTRTPKQGPVTGRHEKPAATGREGARAALKALWERPELRTLLSGLAIVAALVLSVVSAISRATQVPDVTALRVLDAAGKPVALDGAFGVLAISRLGDTNPIRLVRLRVESREAFRAPDLVGFWQKTAYAALPGGGVGKCTFPPPDGVLRLVPEAARGRILTELAALRTLDAALDDQLERVGVRLPTIEAGETPAEPGPKPEPVVLRAAPPPGDFFTVLEAGTPYLLGALGIVGAVLFVRARIAAARAPKRLRVLAQEGGARLSAADVCVLRVAAAEGEPLPSEASVLLPDETGGYLVPPAEPQKRVWLTVAGRRRFPQMRVAPTELRVELEALEDGGAPKDADLVELRLLSELDRAVGLALRDVGHSREELDAARERVLDREADADDPARLIALEVERVRVRETARAREAEAKRKLEEETAALPLSPRTAPRAAYSEGGAPPSPARTTGSRAAHVDTPLTASRPTPPESSGKSLAERVAAWVRVLGPGGKPLPVSDVVVLFAPRPLESEVAVRVLPLPPDPRGLFPVPKLPQNPPLILDLHVFARRMQPRFGFAVFGAPTGGDDALSVTLKPTGEGITAQTDEVIKALKARDPRVPKALERIGL